ncbi:PPE domain-containing protein [Mycobacterium noviomagense]|uniref:PPE domain-containing protein n=1 Tax=Mycobacterium noviomagense TaxID=459858 RepID=UPI003F71B832
MIPEYALFHPESNSASIYVGSASGPMLAASAWSGPAANLISVATAYRSASIMVASAIPRPQRVPPGRTPICRV